MNARAVLRKMTERDLASVLSWRNDPAVRACMFERDIISLEQHQEWFAAAQKNRRKALLIYEQNQEATGFMQFDIDASGQTGTWGFYMKPDHVKGSGLAMGARALIYAFSELCLHKVAAQVIVSNLASVRFHQRLGFAQEGCLRQHFYDGHAYQDVLSFGKLSSEHHLAHLGDAV
jgi:UDP-4-amino-4,6-dideoxy-N-acetyl-beta-L-altrosamine N-acetyltransferase